MELSAADIVGLVRALGTDGATCPLRVTGTSMSPTLRDGRDRVLLRALGPSERVRRGDVALFRRSDGRPVLHRVVGARRNGDLVFNGDAQTWTEEVPRERVVAVAVCVDRAGRLVSARCAAFRLYGILWMALRPLRPALRRLRDALRGSGARS